ncbi:MAG: hypothetical protein IJK58_01975 [Clostridia bacterium]|nr:hypothetical protein [Clostridia bacterium]
MAAEYFRGEFEVLRGEPETGRWYTVPVDGTVSSDGSRWRGIIKKGASRNLLVFFVGGGLSVDPFSAARPHHRPDSEGNGFYSPYLSEGSIEEEKRLTREGITSDDPSNPFHDWTVIMPAYTTGDLDIGTAEREYTDLEGGKRTVFYHGYTNYIAFLEKAIGILGGSYSDLVVCGYSAGGFSASLLYDDTVSRLEITGNRCVVVDSSLFLLDWRRVLADEWETPDHIRRISKTDDLAYDGIKHLADRYGGAVKIVYCCSVRDYALSQVQVYYDGLGDDMPTEATPDAADRFQARLKEAVGRIEKTVPCASVYLWDNLAVERGHITRHTGTNNDVFLRKMDNEISLCECIQHALGGRTGVWGKEFLEKEY